MSSPHGEFLNRLRETFRIEADEHVQTISAGLLELEQMPPPPQERAIVEQVFRAAHSLKGAARAVEFAEIETLCGSLEDRFASWKRGDGKPSAPELDTLHRKLSAIAALIVPQAAAARPVPVAQRDTGPMGFDLAGPPDTGPPLLGEQRATAPGETVRIGVALLDARLLEAEEMLAVKLSAGQRLEGLRELTQRIHDWRGELAVLDGELRAPRNGAGVAAAHAPLAHLFDRNREMLQSLDSQVAGLTRAALQDSETIGKLVDDLLAGSKKLLLLPFATVAAALPKVVRDLCLDQGKQAELKIKGEHIELDKRILDEIKDPLIHLLRNCVDHGIELPAERIRRGKPPKATIRLKVAQVGGDRVQITLSDDGAGIDTDKVRAAAVARGLLTPEQAQRLSEAQARGLIFRSDLSTSPIITQLSGRGLGLAIVREKAARLGGDVSVESAPGEGTLFRITVSAVRATFRGVLVGVGGQLLVLPTTQVERVARVGPGEIRTVEGRETVSLDGRVLPLLAMADVLELPQRRRPPAATGARSLVVLGRGDQRIAFAVDEVLDEQEILVKPLLRPLARVRNIAAATVLGSGAVALVLHVSDLLKSALAAGNRPAQAAPQDLPADARSVLVAEDSITSRMLIKSVLESAGYRVATAVDGMDAFTRLQTERFDALVSDVEMPRLNGFDLTARIRADKNLAELPVVLVTALEARQDRERGIDVGANAYIVKSGFDQGNLIDAVRRLV